MRTFKNLPSQQLASIQYSIISSSHHVVHYIPGLMHLTTGSLYLWTPSPTSPILPSPIPCLWQPSICSLNPWVCILFILDSPISEIMQYLSFSVWYNQLLDAFEICAEVCPFLYPLSKLHYIVCEGNLFAFSCFSPLWVFSLSGSFKHWLFLPQKMWNWGHSSNEIICFSNITFLLCFLCFHIFLYALNNVVSMLVMVESFERHFIIEWLNSAYVIPRKWISQIWNDKYIKALLEFIHTQAVRRTAESVWKTESKSQSLKKQESSRKTSIFALLTMPKPINCGKFWKRWEYQTTWPASWETCMEVRKQQLKLDMEQQTGSK